MLCIPTRLDPCGGSINTGEMTAITANYEHSTSTGYRCVWEVDVGQGRAILELDTVKLTRCCDRLTVSCPCPLKSDQSITVF